jgi:hypothetical protein
MAIKTDASKVLWVIRATVDQCDNVVNLFGGSDDALGFADVAKRGGS